jgi:hypothetical protein
MAKLYNISDWSEQSWWNTGGTRDKKIYLNPEDGELYYFKQSFKKGQRDYKYEFWSEIIASEIGVMLEFDVLRYDIAIRGNVVGCISKSMINQASEELVEGGKYLQAFDNTFNPENVKQRNQYTFELIVGALNLFQKENHLAELIEVIVFDALIGNSDRHQENWGLINKHTSISQGIKLMENDLETEYTKKDLQKSSVWYKRLLERLFYTDAGEVRQEIKQARLISSKETRFAPIYDSGCCFGRQLEDVAVTQMLTDEREIIKFINKGQSEIHWENKKISHFELIEKIFQIQEYKHFVINSLEKIISKFNIEEVQNLVFKIDAHLIKIDNPNILPSKRKELIIKLLTLRFEKLEKMYSQMR